MLPGQIIDAHDIASLQLRQIEKILDAANVVIQILDRSRKRW